MVRTDGNYVIYLIQHKERSGKWVRSIENERYFKSSDECWQITGIHGTFDLEQAKRVYEKIVEIEEEGYIYRLAKVSINQKTEDVDLIKKDEVLEYVTNKDFVELMKIVSNISTKTTDSDYYRGLRNWNEESNEENQEKLFVLMKKYGYLKT